MAEVVWRGEGRTAAGSAGLCEFPRLGRAVVFEEAVKGGAADAEELRGADFVSIDAREDTGDVTKYGAVEGGIVEAGRVVGERRRSRFGGSPFEGRYIEEANPLAGAVEGCGGDDGFEFADIAWPVIGSEAAEGAGPESAQELAALAYGTAQEERSEDGDVVAALAERGQGEADGGEMAGKVGAEYAGNSQLAQRVAGRDEHLEGTEARASADAFVGCTFEEVAKEALLVGGKLVDAREPEQAVAGLLPEVGGIAQELGGDPGLKGAVSGGAELMKGLGGKQLAGAGFALDGRKAKIGRGGAHAGEEMLHDEAAARHFAEHSLLRAEGFGKERGREAFGLVRNGRLAGFFDGQPGFCADVGGQHASIHS